MSRHLPVSRNFFNNILPYPESLKPRAERQIRPHLLKAGNKEWDTALTAIEMASLRKLLFKSGE